LLPAGNPVTPGTIIEADWANTTMSEIAAALTGSIAADGQTNPINNLPMNGYHHTGVSDATARNQYLTLGYAQDGNVSQLANVPPTATNNITGTLVGWGGGTPANYSPGTIVGWFQPVTNTGPMTIDVSYVGSRSIVTAAESPLIGGDLLAGNYYVAYYDGTKFILISSTATSTARTEAQDSVSGWARPDSTGAYPAPVISGTSVVIPAGSGVIVAPGQPSVTNPNIRFSWPEITAPITTMGAGWCTHVLMGQSAGVGTVFLQPNVITPEQMRNYVYICTVEHTDGVTLTALVQRPAILGDDGYLMRDAISLVTNTLVTGGKLTGDAANLTLDIAAGTVLLPGASNANIYSPNVLQVAAGTDISFIPVRGANVKSNVTTLVDTAQYDPNGAGTLAPVTGPECAIHRLYLLDGKYFMVYGQQKYATYTTAVGHYMLDSSNFQPPSYLATGVFIAAILFTGGMTNFSTPNVNFAFFSGSSRQYLFGSSNSLADAPNDTFTYGRFQSTWVPVSSATAPVFANSATVEGTTPTLTLQVTPAGGDAEFLINNGAFRWFAIQADNPAGNVNLIAYNPATGNAVSAVAINTTTGAWALPGNSTIGGVGVGNVTGPATATANGMAIYNGATGKFIKDGPVPGNVVTRDIQVTVPAAGPTTKVLVEGSYGLGTTGAAVIPAGTTAQRPSPQTQGSIRFNTTLGVPEYAVDAGTAWATMGAPVPGLISGFKLDTNSVPLAGLFGAAISPGTISSADNTLTGISAVTIYKRADQAWAQGAGTLAAPTGARGFPGAPVANAWYRMFVIMKPDGTCDAGYDDNATATNLLAAAAGAGFTKYRRIGWVQMTGAANSFMQFVTAALNTYQRYDRTPATIVENGITVCSSLPPNTLARLGVRMDLTGGRFALIGTQTGAPSATNFTMCNSGSGEIDARLSATSGVLTTVSNPNAITTILQRGWYDDLQTP